MSKLGERIKDHSRVSSALALQSDKVLIDLLEKQQGHRGWGTNRVIEVAGRKVFVKQISVTDLEMSDPYSTKNVFRIPVYYNYGVGSAGFGAFRELAAHIKTTNWVLAREIEHFPLLHHHRIVRMDAPPPPTHIISCQKPA